ncbi:MBL fold metallo-hydrolase [Candidatus Peregrinibacteria bacterium]|nr:MBL fold metallo-hydrolase [Candidatus Peregrinibacteria bacterium]
MHVTLNRIPNEAEVHFLDVGQGDSILIVTPSLQTVLIDGGPGEKVLEELGALLPFFVREIDMIVLTHPHSDHLEGLTEAMKRYGVRHVLLAGDAYGSRTYQEFLKTINEKSLAGEIAVHFASKGSDFAVPFEENSGLFFDTLYPIENIAGKEIDNTNNASVVLKMSPIIGQFVDISKNIPNGYLKGENGLFKTKINAESLPGQTFLFTGDCEIECEEEILHHYKFDTDSAGQNILQSDILKVGHHGSRTATSQAFLDVILPGIAVIQSGVDNKFDHPHDETVQKLKNANVKIRENTDEGRITLPVEFWRRDV